MNAHVVDPAAVGPSTPPAPLASRTSAFSAGAKRVTAALVGVPLLYVLTLYLPPPAFFALVAATVLLAQWECTGLFVAPPHRARQTVVGFLCSLTLLTAMQWPAMLDLAPALWLVVAVMCVYQVGYAPAGLRQPAIFVLLFGVLAIGYTLGHLLWLRNRPDGAGLIFFVLLVTWAGDAAAYYTGTWWGSRPLAPSISPNKTKEGVLGGLIVAPVAAWLGHLWWLPDVTPLDCLTLGLLLTVLGLVGDLSESALKRHAGVKDSGAVIPGHGGMFDRVDSLLLTVPAFYYYVVYVKGL